MEEIATVYARSLFEVAREAGSLETVREQLGQVVDVLSGNREMQVFLFSPYFSTQEKQGGLERAIDGADPALMNFLRLVVEKHRAPALFRIRQHFDRLWEAEHRRLPVAITSAVELDAATVDKLSQQIGAQTDREIDLDTRVDPNILGGIILRVGNSILDASIRNRLEQLRKQVATA